MEEFNFEPRTFVARADLPEGRALHLSLDGTYIDVLVYPAGRPQRPTLEAHGFATDGPSAKLVASAIGRLFKRLVLEGLIDMNPREDISSGDDLIVPARDVGPLGLRLQEIGTEQGFFWMQLVEPRGAQADPTKVGHPVLTAGRSVLSVSGIAVDSIARGKCQTELASMIACFACDQLLVPGAQQKDPMPAY